MSAVLPLRAEPALHTGERLHAADTAKAIGIVLVVLGHAPGTPQWLVALIYSFHMPLFFFLSGYLLSPDRAGMPWQASLRRHARSLLVPYVFFFAVSLLFWLATRGIGARADKFSTMGPADALLGLATGLSTDLFVNPPLWFFPALFSCALIYAALRRVLGAWAVAALALPLSVALLHLDWPTRLPWGLDIAGIVLVFYAAGHALRCHAPTALAPVRSAAAWSFALGLMLLAMLWWHMAMAQWRVDLAELRFTERRWLYLPCAAGGIALVLGVSKLAPPSALARWLSDNSLVIFPLHALAFMVGSGLVKAVWPQAAEAGYSGAWCLPFVVWSLATIYPVAWLLTRHVPVLLGRPPVRFTGSSFR